MKKRVKTGGRKAGTPNKTTKETKVVLQEVLSKELNKLGALLEKLDPIERVNAISKLLPYILPKQNLVKADVKADIKTEAVLSPEQREKRIAELIAKAKK